MVEHIDTGLAQPTNEAEFAMKNATQSRKQVGDV